MPKNINLATCTEGEREQYWTDFANERLQGLTVKCCRYLSEEEAEALGWSGRCLVVEFNNGFKIFSSRDDEGNGPGTLFGKKGDKILGFPLL